MWHAFFELHNGLLNAPTGSGKTFALWIPAAVNAATTKYSGKNRLKILWITPLRALANDIQFALNEFCQENDLPVSSMYVAIQLPKEQASTLPAKQTTKRAGDVPGYGGGVTVLDWIADQVACLDILTPAFAAIE